jgi:hypothetical protein
VGLEHRTVRRAALLRATEIHTTGSSGLICDGKLHVQLN